jgi:ribonuclease P protein component
LRELARSVFPVSGKIGHDYVLVGRANITAITKFVAMQAELDIALQELHAKS